MVDADLSQLFDCRALRQVIAKLLGSEAVLTLTPTPQLLFTPPNADKWLVPHEYWHVDVPRLPAPGAPGLLAFIIIDPVECGGGGTTIVSGSHRLLNDGRKLSSRNVVVRLRDRHWFEALLNPSKRQHEWSSKEVSYVCGTCMQIVELCGLPGDVYFVDTRTLHALSPNALRRPRIMFLQRFVLESQFVEAMNDADGRQPEAFD